MTTKRKIETAEDIWDAAIAETPVETDFPIRPRPMPTYHRYAFCLGVLVGACYQIIIAGIVWVVG
jgi:hypothetical protein